MSKEEIRKKAEEEALKAFPDYKREDGQNVDCSALRWNFIRGYEVGYEEACKESNGDAKIPNSVWHDITIVPKYNPNGITDFIVSSAYGHIEGEAHTYTPDQWSAHIGFNVNRDFKWAYESDLIMEE